MECKPAPSSKSICHTSDPCGHTSDPCVWNILFVAWEDACWVCAMRHMTRTKKNWVFETWSNSVVETHTIQAFSDLWYIDGTQKHILTLRCLRICRQMSNWGSSAKQAKVAWLEISFLVGKAWKWRECHERKRHTSVVSYSCKAQALDASIIDTLMQYFPREPKLFLYAMQRPDSKDLTGKVIPLNCCCVASKVLSTRYHHRNSE